VIVLVEADPEIQKRRIALRDDCSAEEAQSLISAQASSPERRRYADYIIQNVGGVEALERAVGDVYRKILTSA
jgi:dephospho-CoA kinase